jgi:hypothetical protein
MKFRIPTLYEKLKSCVEDACRDSLSWRPHTAKYQSLIHSIVAEEIVYRNIKWWAPNRPESEEAESWINKFFEGYQEETQNGLVWNAEVFDRVYSRLEEFLCQDSYVSHFASLLNSFSFYSVTSVELETGVYIRKADNFLSNILKNQELNVGYSANIGDWVVDIIIQQPKSVERESADSHTAKASKKLRMVLQSLRLLHKGKVFVGPLHFPIFPEFGGFKRNVGVLLETDLTTLPSAYLGYFTLGSYELAESEVEELKTIYGLVSKETSRYPNSFALALSRFNDYFGRVNELDGLLDLVIALEALFAGESQEIGYSLALRCSYFLEPDAEKRKAIFTRLRDIYDIRSYIVHGRAGLPKKWSKLRGEDYDIAIASVVDDAEGYVRQAIRKIIADKHLDKFQNLVCWRRFLDELVLIGGACSD